jgi:N-methylhydantoinase B/oxoprolinase/acetone carboxylase alpha subunit
MPGGRPKGALNKTTADIRQLAQDYGQQAIERLVKIANESENEQAVISAVKEILDRGFGKAKQSVEVEGGLELKHVKVSFE